MSRTTIAAVLALLVLLAPAANARPLVQPERMTDTGAETKVMPERVTDHPLPAYPSPGREARESGAIAQERYYGSYQPVDDAANSVLVREQESTNGSGNQGVASSTGGTSDDGTPWAIVAAGIAAAALVAAGLTMTARRSRARARVAA